MNGRTLFAVALATGLVTASAGRADGWKKTAAIYGWGTWIDGNASYGPKTGSVDVDAKDVLDSLEFGAMARFRAENDRFAIVFDGIYASLGGSKDTFPRVKLDLNQYIFQLDGAYKFAPHAEALLGVRYVRFESTLDVGGAGPLPSKRFSGDASFWDPVIGLRTIAPLSDKWRVQAQGDVGGGANMDFTWQAMLNFGYQPGDNASFWFGYRALGMDFDHSGNNNRFGMDTTMHGPVVGLAFKL